jgi:hypothetical protein
VLSRGRRTSSYWPAGSAWSASGTGRAESGLAGWTRLDGHNQAVLKAVQLGGRAFLAGTTVDGAFALRACIVNPGLTSDRVPVLLDDVRDRAAELLGAG